MAPSDLTARSVSGEVVRDLASFRRWAARRLSGLSYVGPDPQHALGLASLIPEFAALSSAAPALTVLERAGALTLDVDGADGSDAAALLQTPEVARFLDERAPGSPLFVFKPSHRIVELASAHGWHLLAPPAAVARRWENKIAFSGLAKQLELRVPDFRVVGSLPEAAAAFTDLGGDVVVQSPHGYAGARTLRVTQLEDLGPALSTLRSPQLRLARSVAGTPWTVNGCVTARGTAISAPTLQLTGVPCLTTRPMGACGNDGTSTSESVPAMRAAARQLGTALARDGYRGLFGVDFVVDDQGPWVIEVNPRLVSSVGLATQAQVTEGKVPLVGRHFMALVEPEADALDLDHDIEPLGASQIVLHNLEGTELVVRGDLRAGGLIVEHGDREASRTQGFGSGPMGQSAGASAGRSGAGRLVVTSVSGLADVPEGSWLVLPAGKGRLRSAGAEVARLQRWGPVADGSGRLAADAEEAARAVYEALDLGPSLEPEGSEGSGC